MSEDPLALVIPPPSEAEYDAIYQALAETARGRCFLAEYARRSRPAETESGLAAIARLGAAIRQDNAQPAGHLRLDIAAMAQAIARAKAEITAIKQGTGAAEVALQDLNAYAQKVVALLAALEGRFNSMVDAWDKEPVPTQDQAEGPAAAHDERQDASIEEISQFMMALDPLVVAPHSAPVPVETRAEDEALHIAAVEPSMTQQPPAPQPEPEPPAQKDAIETQTSIFGRPQVVLDLLPKSVPETSVPPPTQAVDPAPVMQNPVGVLPAAEWESPPASGDQADSSSRADLAAPVENVAPAAVALEADADDFLFAPAAELEVSTPAPPASSASSAPVVLKPAAPMPNDPLAPLRALSDEEKIALFS
jgi:hypothetical protein